jgi:hypothetical protein
VNQPPTRGVTASHANAPATPTAMTISRVAIAVVSPSPSSANGR